MWFAGSEHKEQRVFSSIYVIDGEIIESSIAKTEDLNEKVHNEVYFWILKDSIGDFLSFMEVKFALDQSHHFF